MAYLPLVARYVKPSLRCRRDVQSACHLFRQFHRFEPPRLVSHQCRRTIPRVMVGLGKLKALVYTSDKDTPGRPRTFIHFMDDRPHLTSDVAGRQLYIVGGSYRVTPRGIEG